MPIRLKRLSLHGYKTFASRTSFEFGEGITAVVGPNGSGKSNIADAIRWVLGEQSYSTLRGKKTTDMIFAGSQTRPRAGMAQATLTLDNSEGWLPIEYSEIEVSRRAYRSGENEYLLNGNKVRLRDVSELLATSGLARRTYTIIGQGLVDQALSLRADERRMLFEEAAGISQYKSKRAETLRRLQEADHNLERLHDIVSEIKPRLTSLRRQAKRASNYEQVATDLRYHLRIWYGYRWVQARNSLREHRLASQNARGLWEESRKIRLDLQKGLKSKRERVNGLSEALQNLEAEREKQRDKLEVVRRNAAVLMEREKELQRQAFEIAEEVPGLHSQQEKARQELDASIVELNRAQESVESEQEKLEHIDLETKTQRQKIASHEDLVARLQKDLRQSLDRLATTKGRLDQQRFQLGELEETKLDKSELLDAQQDLQNSADNLASTTDIVSKLEEDRSNGLKRLESLGNKLLRLETTIIGMQSEIDEARELISALVVRRDLLGQMRGNDSTLPEKFTNAPRLFDQIRIPSKYRIAIEAALGYHLEALIFQEDSVLWELENEPEKRLILLIANRMSPQRSQKAPNNRGVIGWASDLVTFPDNTNALKSILSTVLIVENRSDALNLGMQGRPSTLVVSLDGLVIHPNGLVEIGSIGAKGSVLAREEEWLSSNQELASLAERQHTSQRKLEATQNSLTSLNLDREKLQEVDSNLATKIEEERNNLASLQRDADRNQQKLEQVQEKQSLRARQSQNLAASIDAGQKTVTTLEKESLDLQSEFEKSKELLDALPAVKITEQRDQQIQQVDSARTILAGRQAVVDSRRATMNQIDELLTRRNERKLDIKDRLNQLDLEGNQASLQAIEQNSETLGMKLTPLVSKLANQRQELSKLEIAADKVQSQGHELETLFSQSRIELSQAENVLENLKERISAELGVIVLSYDDNQPEQSPLPMDDIVEHLPEIKELPEDIEETIHRYRGQLNRIGGINPEAPAEYEATTQRYQHLQQQIEDLINTQVRLQGVIEELDDKTSQTFAATVRKVDAAFGDVFRRLFGGGSAKLILTDPDNLVDSGVEIIARLPRRREQGLALLSGGERSLTATALVFALLKVSPTPFCVLDEVDAMLDEANVNRFRDLLQELSQRTQFILITHNRGTVQVAESVYGISMGSDSVSQVISIKPEDYLVGSPATS